MKFYLMFGLLLILLNQNFIKAKVGPNCEYVCAYHNSDNPKGNHGFLHVNDCTECYSRATEECAERGSALQHAHCSIKPEIRLLG